MLCEIILKSTRNIVLSIFVFPIVWIRTFLILFERFKGTFKFYRKLTLLVIGFIRLMKWIIIYAFTAGFAKFFLISFHGNFQLLPFVGKLLRHPHFWDNFLSLDRKWCLFNLRPYSLLQNPKLGFFGTPILALCHLKSYAYGILAILPFTMLILFLIILTLLDISSICLIIIIIISRLNWHFFLRSQWAILLGFCVNSWWLKWTLKLLVILSCLRYGFVVWNYCRFWCVLRKNFFLKVVKFSDCKRLFIILNNHVRKWL